MLQLHRLIKWSLLLVKKYCSAHAILSTTYTNPNMITLKYPLAIINGIDATEIYPQDDMFQKFIC